MSFVVGHVGHAPQATTDDLLAEELGREGAHAEDVGDGVGVPALGEHRDADDAADLLAQLAGLADRVHDLAQQVLVGQVLGRAAGEALAVLGLELLDLGGGDLLELGTHRLARLELLGVDQDGVGALGPPAVLDVAEERQVAGGDRRHAVGQGDLPPGDPVVDQLADVGVVADDDEDRRREVGGIGAVA